AVAIDAKHLRALARKGHRGRLAIAPTGTDRASADHQRCLPLEPFHRLLPFDSVIVVVVARMERLRNPGSCRCPGCAEPVAPSPNSPASSRSVTFELPHRLASGEQTFRGVVGRHVDQRAIQLEPRLGGGAGGFERGYDIARAT